MEQSKDSLTALLKLLKLSVLTISYLEEDVIKKSVMHHYFQMMPTTEISTEQAEHIIDHFMRQIHMNELDLSLSKNINAVDLVADEVHRVYESEFSSS